VLGILRGHRGAIDVRSEAGEGTTIKVLLPAARGLPETAAVGATSPDAATTLVLVVDDEEIVRRMMKRALERAGYRVLLAADGVEALEIWQTHGDQIALVVLDVMMPRMGGEETLARLRAISPEVRVLLASGFSETEALGRFGDKGVSGFLSKPFTPDLLLASVRELSGR
jgi:two-component system, cell cycle sensor histidine kinase and response regulator CckA